MEKCLNLITLFSRPPWPTDKVRQQTTLSPANILNQLDSTPTILKKNLITKKIDADSYIEICDISKNDKVISCIIILIFLNS